MRIPPLPILAALVLLSASPAAGGLGDKKTLVIEGRTLDAHGSPVAKVRVTVEGPRQVSGLSRGDGRFSLSVPIGTPGDLRSAPLRIEVTAVRRGWRFTCGGQGRLGVELTMEVATGGMARCVGRSNDARFAAAVARLMALEGDAIGSAAVNFTGVQGEIAGDEPLPPLDYVARAAFSFAVPELGEVVPAPEAAPRDGRAPTGSVEPAPPRSPVPGLDERLQPRKPRRAPRPSEAERALAEIRERAARDSAAAVARAAAREAKRVAKIQERAEKAVAHSTDREARAAAGVAEPRRVVRVTSPLPAPGDTVPAVAATAPPIARDEVDLPSVTPPAVRKETGTPAPASRGDSLMARWRDAEWRPTRGGAPTPQVSAPSPAPPGPAAAPTPEPTVSGPVIVPEPPLKVSRARSRPLVIRNPSPAGRVTADTCQCRIEGTVEVLSDSPLKNPERVEVSLQWYPQIRDTVELFMGSPRPFRLPVAPCGPQRLRLRVLSGAPFAIVNREAAAGFKCDGDRVLQPRVVLAPR